VKTNGSIYVAVVFAALTGYFVYQWWFNPNRIVKSRLGDIAAALSIPAGEAELGRMTRLSGLRKLAVMDVHVRIGKDGPEFTARDAAIAAMAAWTAPHGGWNVDFVDADVLVSSETTARAYVTADMTTKDPETGRQTLDSRDVTFSFKKQAGEWLVSEAEVKDLPKAR
jgi:hypothetical protein